jgi:hypothetical protein
MKISELKNLLKIKRKRNNQKYRSIKLILMEKLKEHMNTIQNILNKETKLSRIVLKEIGK